MAKFILTINSPSQNGKTPHTIMCNHDAETIEDFISSFGGDDFFVVNEVYKPDENYPNGHEVRVGINYNVISKIKVWG